MLACSPARAVLRASLLCTHTAGSRAARPSLACRGSMPPPPAASPQGLTRRGVGCVPAADRCLGAPAPRTSPAHSNRQPSNERAAARPLGGHELQPFAHWAHPPSTFLVHHACCTPSAPLTLPVGHPPLSNPPPSTCLPCCPGTRPPTRPPPTAASWRARARRRWRRCSAWRGRPGSRRACWPSSTSWSSAAASARSWRSRVRAGTGRGRSPRLVWGGGVRAPVARACTRLLHRTALG